MRDAGRARGPGAAAQRGQGAEGRLQGRRAVLPAHASTARASGGQAGARGNDPADLFKYVVHYADGQTADVPVLYGEGVDHWIDKEPAGLKSAVGGLGGPVPRRASPSEQAVVYQFRGPTRGRKWRSPGVDMVYGPQGSQYGTPGPAGHHGGDGGQVAAGAAARRKEKGQVHPDSALFRLPRFKLLQNRRPTT